MSCYGSLSDICVVAYESGHLCLFDSSTHSIIEEYSLFHSPSIFIFLLLNSSLMCIIY